MPIINRISRPLDSLPGSTALSSLSNKTVDILYRIAYDYYRSSQYRELFDQECITRRDSIFNDEKMAILYTSKWQSIRDGLSDVTIKVNRTDIAHIIDDLCELSNQLDDQSLFVTPKRLQHTQTISHEELIGQADAYQVADYLSTKKSDLRRLLDASIIKQLAGHRTTRDALFDIRDINLSFSASKALKRQEHISYREIVDSKYLDYFRCTLADLIYEIKNKKLVALSKSDGSTLGDLFFDRHELNSALESKIHDNKTDISVRNLAKLYSIDTQSVFKLVKTGHLYANHWQSPKNIAETDVKLDSFKYFHDKYICLNREARKRNRRIKVIENSVVNQGVHIDIQIGKSLFVNRTHDCMDIINNIPAKELTLCT